jgi:hypothetical protein|tara:strand:- start:597 stop:836 length:240 start_codon:yes stop_codon:yes gene_type:complete
MKIGDLARSVPVDCKDPDRWGLVVDVIQKKCWRTWRDGKNVDWDSILPEPHAVILFPWNSGTIEMPFTELEEWNDYEIS